MSVHLESTPNTIEYLPATTRPLGELSLRGAAPPEDYEEPLAWIKLSAWLDRRSKEPARFSTERFLCDPEQYINKLDPDALLANLPLVLKTIPNYDTAMLVRELEEKGRLSDIISNLPVVRDILPGYDVMKGLNGLEKDPIGASLSLNAIANNLPTIVDKLPDYDVEGLVRKIEDAGWLGVIMDNLPAIMDKLPGYDVEGLVRKLEDAGLLVAVVNNLSTIVDKLPDYDVKGLVRKIESAGWLGVIMNNLPAIMDKLPDYDVKGLVRKLEDAWSLVAVVNNLSTIVDKLPDYDVEGLVKLILTGFERLDGATTEALRPHIPNIAEITSRHRLAMIATGSHDLLTDLEGVEALEKPLYGKPGYLPFITSDIMKFRKLSLSNYSYDCFKLLFEPLENDTDEGKRLKDQLNRLGVDAHDTASAINQTISLLTNSIAGTLEGRSTAEENAILNTAYGRKLALHILRVKRGR